MADLHTDLATLATRVPPTTTEVVDADITRGRIALRRRRTATLATTSLAVTAVLASGAVLTATAGGTTDPVRTPAAASTTSTTTASSAQTDTAPVAPPAFVATPGITSGPFTSQLAPAGWVVQDPTDVFGLRLTDPTQPPTDFAPLTVTLASLDAQTPSGPTALTVNDNPAWIYHDDQRLPADQLHSLVTQLPDGRYLEITYEGTVGWTDQQILDFATGITVSPDAPRTRG